VRRCVLPRFLNSLPRKRQFIPDGWIRSAALCVITLIVGEPVWAANTLTTSVLGTPNPPTTSGNPTTFTARATDSGGAALVQSITVYMKASAAASSDVLINLDLINNVFWIANNNTGTSTWPRTPIVLGTQTVSPALVLTGLTVTSVGLAKSGNNVDFTVTVSRDSTWPGDKVLTLAAYDGTIYSQPWTTTTAATWTLGAIAPTAPGNFTATPISSSQINLSWSPSTGGSGNYLYNVLRNGVQITANLPSTTLSLADTGLSPSTTYTYSAHAWDNTSQLGSPSTGVISATTLGGSDTTPPTAPTGLTATAASSSQVNLSWGASSDNVAVTGYKVERCTGAGCTTFVQIATPTTTPYSDTGLSASTSYSYRARATDAAGNLSPYSSTASATTATAAVPTAPGNVTATANSSSQVTVTWTASTGGSGVYLYYVYRNGTLIASALSVTTFTYVDTGLAASTIYSYYVRTWDNAPQTQVSSPNSATVSATTLAAGGDTTPPTAPSGLIVVASSSTEIDLAWTAATDNVAVTGYNVERCAGAACASFVQIATPGMTTYNDAGLTAATPYSYRMRAHDAAGNLSPYSGTLTVSTPIASPDCN